MSAASGTRQLNSTSCQGIRRGEHRKISQLDLLPDTGGIRGLLMLLFYKVPLKFSQGQSATVQALGKVIDRVKTRNLDGSVSYMSLPHFCSLSYEILSLPNTLRHSSPRCPLARPMVPVIQQNIRSYLAAGSTAWPPISSQNGGPTESNSYAKHVESPCGISLTVN